MAYFSYVVRRDFGFAPNPFGQYCTLATCKQDIRLRAKVEDWIIGTGSKEYNRFQHLIFIMKISEILTMQKYWEDSRFNYKKPIMNGSLIGMYGDNIYHKRDVKGKWLQEDSHHSKEDGIVNQQNLERDLSGENVLISNEFVYLGKKSFLLPPKYRMNICKTGPGYKKDALDSELAESLIQEIVLNYGLGVKSIPNQMTTNFKRYNGK